jgi:hypothetical protein
MSNVHSRPPAGNVNRLAVLIDAFFLAAYPVVGLLIERGLREFLGGLR